MITINLDKAKKVKKDILRFERAPILEKLDVEMLKSWGDPEKLAEIDAKKQILRDATKLVDPIESIEELQALTLPDLE